jgi:hypothetical protein
MVPLERVEDVPVVMAALRLREAPLRAQSIAQDWRC